MRPSSNADNTDPDLTLLLFQIIPSLTTAGYSIICFFLIFSFTTPLSLAIGTMSLGLAATGSSPRVYKDINTINAQ